MPTALIGLGANLGDRQQSLNRAVQWLAATPGITAVRCSSWHATSPIGGPPNQPDFLNGAALLETSLPPEALLARLLEIERSLGRERTQHHGPRTIDLDLLLYDRLVQHTPGLQLPHPRMAYRRFALQPAAEVAADMLHPTSGWTIAQLFHHLQTATPYIAISGSLYEATQPLAQAVAVNTHCKLLEYAQEITVAAPAGSPSLGLPQTIEFFREQAAVLSRENWPAAPGVGVITPFWIEDLLAVASVLWPGELDSTWQSLSASVIPPKLLVVYEANSTQLRNAETTKPHSSVAVALWHRLNEARRQRAARPGIGPVLWLTAENPTAAQAELTAAIQSMS